MKISNILIGALLVCSATGCQKILDAKPESDLDASTRFKNIEDYQFALLGAYSFFQSTSYYSGTDARSNAFACLPDMLGDDLRETGENLGNELIFSRWRFAEDENQIELTWLNAYKVIMQANLCLRNIDNFSATSPGAVNRIKGQALAIRALVHFDLLRYWADTYNRNTDTLGVPYITEYNYEQKPARATIRANYASIENDLKTALTLFSDIDEDINVAGERAYIDANAANALLARMFLYSGQMDSAVKYSTFVIDEIPLASRADFPGIWTDVNIDEVVWSLSYDAGQGLIAGNVYAPDVDRSQYEPSVDLLDLYDAAKDVRYNAYFKDISDRIVLSKYIAKNSRLKKPDGVVNFKAIRTAEMYLIRAEAYARLAAPNFVAAMKDLNDLRAARITGYVPEVLTGAALLDAIELERRKELIAEGHRFFDLKRKGRGLRTVDRTNCTGSYCTLASNRREWTWPIPRPEIDANPNIGPQNPGY